MCFVFLAAGTDVGVVGAIIVIVDVRFDRVIFLSYFYPVLETL